MLSPERIKAILKSRWFEQDDFCWKCGNKGFWFEQIDGPDNQRKVYCDCPAGVKEK